MEYYRFTTREGEVHYREFESNDEAKEFLRTTEEHGRGTRLERAEWKRVDFRDGGLANGG